MCFDMEVLLVKFRFLDYNVCDFQLFYSQFVQTVTSSVILFHFADACDCLLVQAFIGHGFKMLTCRCGKHSNLLRNTNK